MNFKRKRHEGTHYLSRRQFSGSTFGSLVTKWKNYFNYCTALNYSLWRKWWQVCRAITVPLPLASLSVLMKKPLHTTRVRTTVRGGGALSPDSQICCNDCKSVKKLSFKVNRDCRFASLVDTWTLKSQYSKIFSQLLEVNWMRFLLLNLLTACHLINRPSVLLCSGLPHGSKLKANLFLQIFPQQTLGNDMCWNILLSYLLRKTPRGRWILLMLALAPC